MMYGMNGMGFSGMWFGWILWLIIIGLIIWGVITIVNNTKNRPPRGGYYLPREDALDILKNRYAKGEIDEEQYETMKKRLKY